MSKDSRPKIIMAIQHHDWDTTLFAAKDLLDLGVDPANKNRAFACYTGSMVLCVATLESFMNSMGYSEDLSISWDSYQRLPIIDKLRLIGRLVGISVDVGHEPYQTVVEAVRWRNDLLHSKPESVTGIEVDAESLDDVREKTKKAFPRKYEYKVDKKTATRFYNNIRSVMGSFQEAGKRTADQKKN